MQEWKRQVYESALAAQKEAKEEQKAVKAIEKAMKLAGFDVADFSSFRHDLNIAMHLQGYSSEREFLKIWTVQWKRLKDLNSKLGKLRPDLEKL